MFEDGEVRETEERPKADRFKEPRLMTDGPYLKIAGFIIGVAFLLYFIMQFSVGGSSDTTIYGNNNTYPTVAATAVPQAVPVVYQMGEKVAAGNFGLTVSSAHLTSELNGDKTDNQYVVVKFSITNNDVKARDISSSMFKLVDGAGKTYEATKVYSGDDYLSYDTVNPGLSRTRSIPFETPKGVTLFGLIVDSGVAFAGGKNTIIHLGELSAQ